MTRMALARLLFTSLLVVPMIAAAAVSATNLGGGLVDMNLFVGGVGGYACYRLPNLVQLHSPGHWLTVVQGHKYDVSGPRDCCTPPRLSPRIPTNLPPLPPAHAYCSAATEGGWTFYQGEPSPQPHLTELCPLKPMEFLIISHHLSDGRRISG